jgi:hypothetical protein
VRHLRPWHIASALFAFSCLLYANTLFNDFVWDDRTLVVENAELGALDWPTVERLFSSHYWEFAGKRAALYRPVAALSLHVDHQLHGKDPLGYHLTNTLLNAAVGAWRWRWSRRCSSRRSRSTRRTSRGYRDGPT